MSRQIRTSGGVRDRELKELPVKPHRSPDASTVVAIVTGAGTRAMARVKRERSTVMENIRFAGPGWPAG
ncbi:hypothetical protein GCM10010345_04950 [Streptomyces canarius]|uniref:Uncharacterized protein n=1 Tax=Streptomyces canarius TaxID=285453 RepID=A0ABQ3CE43_9ACTN|nr:hypothetical protein GCM10010300_08120 [Streptomyces olivaceoviridis]GHA03589.1 hypothetical protein GCM10010345_04950 [Streptomyces canarius]